MIAGHFGLAAGVKGRERQVPLWALMLATVWLDIVFAPLLAAGVESIGNVPGSSGGYGKAIIHADWTHSLVGALVLAALFGLVAARPWGRRAGMVLGAVVSPTGCWTWSCTAATCRSCPVTPATCPGSGSGCGRRRPPPSWSSWP